MSAQQVEAGATAQDAGVPAAPLVLGVRGSSLIEYQEELAERLRLAANRPAIDAGGLVRIDVLGVQYGLRAEQIGYVDDLGAVTPLPRFPKAIRGVTTTRGRVAMVIDMLRLCRPDAVANDIASPRIKLLAIKGGDFALAAELFNAPDETAGHETILLDAQDVFNIALSGARMPRPSSLLASALDDPR